MSKDAGLKPDDFPLEADKNELKTHKGEPVASAESERSRISWPNG